MFKFFLALILLLPPSAGALEENQVISKTIDWKVYSTRNFDIYYYEDSKSWLSYAAKTLEDAYIQESLYLNPFLKKRIPFFLFASVNDMEQNTITQVGDGVGGLTEPFKDRFMAWSDGSKGWLKDVICHEFAHEAQFSVLLDGFWKSARILKTYIYPLWMMEGMAEYATGDNDLAVEEMYVRDSVLDGKQLPLWKLQQFGHLKPHQVTLAYKTGAEAVRFLAEEYGRDKPALMLRLYRNRYDINSVLSSLIGCDIFEFGRKFSEYLEIKYYSQVRDQNLQEAGRYGEKLTFQKDEIPDFNLSPVLSVKYSVLAYLSTKAGDSPVIVLRNLKTGREKILDRAETGSENIPYSRFTKPFRTLNISPDGRYLVFSSQKNHEEYLSVYDLEKKKFSKYLMKGFLEARQFSFSPSGSKLVFTGMIKGLNDLYETDFPPSGREIDSSSVPRLTDNSEDKLSPVYSSEKGIFYSCEKEREGKIKREICYVERGGKPRSVLSVDGDITDLFYDAVGGTLYFISDSGKIFSLYSFVPGEKEVLRLTRAAGGVFTPFASENKIYFSYFRNGSINLYEGEKENFLYEKTDFSQQDTLPEASEAPAPAGVYHDYRFRASTDLFFPAFLFSSPGGLFWINYWQASDLLGYHNISWYLNYNSGYPYFSSVADYTYNRYRTRFYFKNENFSEGNLQDDLNLEYKRRYDMQVAGLIYPFDRYRRVEFYLLNKNDVKKYTDIDFTEKNLTRAFQLGYVKDDIGGFYLLAVEGSRLDAIFQKAGEAFGGNDKYDAYAGSYLKYFPLSRRSVFVNRFFGALSGGRDKKEFNYGGINGLRGFSRGGLENENSRVLVYNAELRVPLWRMDYYMWYMFPDFYFKALYFKVFTDNAYGWEKGEEGRFSIGKVKNSVGVGFNLHAFVLQAFQMVLSFDYSVRTDDGGKIFYFYLGPLF